MYEGGIRVPMCAVWPGKSGPGVAIGSCGVDDGSVVQRCVRPRGWNAAAPDGIERFSMLSDLTGGRVSVPRPNGIWSGCAAKVDGRTRAGTISRYGVAIGSSFRTPRSSRMPCIIWLNDPGENKGCWRNSEPKICRESGCSDFGARSKGRPDSVAAARTKLTKSARFYLAGGSSALR